MASNNASKVIVGKPKAGGAIFWAPKGTTAPTDATTALGGSYSCLGYCSEDGLVETEERDVEEVKAWGGDVVLRPQTGYSKTYKFTPIQTDSDVLKFRFGASNVTVDDGTGAITVTHNSGPLPHGVMVAEIAVGDNMVLRKVIADAQVTEFEDTSYVDGEPVGYGATVAAFADSNGNYVKDYYATVEASGTTGATS